MKNLKLTDYGKGKAWIRDNHNELVGFWAIVGLIVGATLAIIIVG